MIKVFHLPEFALLIELLVDPSCCVPLPGSALLVHSSLIGECSQDMDVVRHDNVVREAVTVAVEEV